MAKHGEVTITVDRPIEAVFDFLADGENDKRFSKRILEITKTTDGPAGVGTVYRSTARDFGRTAIHEFEITAFERPVRIRWRELSMGPIVVGDGGYELREQGGGTELTFHGDLEGHGIGKLMLGLVSKQSPGRLARVRQEHQGHDRGRPVMVGRNRAGGIAAVTTWCRPHLTAGVREGSW